MNTPSNAAIRAAMKANAAPPPPPKAKAKPARTRKPRRVVTRKRKRKSPDPRPLRPLVEYVCRKAGIEDRATRDLVHAYCGVIVGSAVVFGKKQKDYGPSNIGNGGALGVLIRANDKIKRLFSLRGKDAANESKSDSALDLHVYGAILWMVMKGIWPGVTEDKALSV